MSSITPSPFRFITPRKQPRQQQKSTSLPKYIAPGRRSLGQGYDKAFLGPGTADTESGVGNNVSDQHKQPEAKKGFPGPNAFFLPSREQVETVQVWEESNEEEERINCKLAICNRDSWGLGNREEGQQKDAEPDIEPSVKRRRVKETDASVLNELMVEDGIEEVGWDIDGEEIEEIENIDDVDSVGEVGGGGGGEKIGEIGVSGEGQEGEESEMSGVVVNFWGKRGDTMVGEGEVAEEDFFLEYLPVAEEQVKVPCCDEPVNLTTCRPFDAHRFLSPLPPTAPGVPTQNPLRFRARPSNISTSATKGKPTKPASSYFRTILALPHQQTDRQQISLPLGLTIPSDWSPSKKRRRRGETSHTKMREGGGKYIDGGLASQILGWTLESLSSNGKGVIFGYGGETGGEDEIWRMVQVVVVSGRDYNAGGLRVGSNDIMMANLSLGGIVVRGEETYGSRKQRRRYLLVTGRGAITLRGKRVIESLKAGEGWVRYKSPWWDMRLNEDGSQSEDEGVYRVLCMWDVVNRNGGCGGVYET